MKRFYKHVSVADDHSILLDGKPILTPAKHKLVLPSRSLARAIAEEWQAQVGDVVPETMLLTKLANTAIDRGARGDIAAELLAFGKSDLLCYRASEPEELARRQSGSWDVVLDWAECTYGARLRTTHGISHIEQDDAAIAALADVLGAHTAWTLIGLHTVTTITGSLVLALAVAENRLAPTEAHELSRIDESFQAEKWGLDAEAERRTARQASELEAAAKFIELARA